MVMLNALIFFSKKTEADGKSSNVSNKADRHDAAIYACRFRRAVVNKAHMKQLSLKCDKKEEVYLSVRCLWRNNFYPQSKSRYTV